MYVQVAWRVAGVGDARAWSILNECNRLDYNSYPANPKSHWAWYAKSAN
jgi:hypothetical protein